MLSRLDREEAGKRTTLGEIQSMDLSNRSERPILALKQMPGSSAYWGKQVRGYGGCGPLLFRSRAWITGAELLIENGLN